MKYVDTGKLAGKTEYAGRRRPTTRKSGFKTNENATGGRYKTEECPVIKMNANAEVKIVFNIKPHNPSDLIGFGLWFKSDSHLEIKIDGESFHKFSLPIQEKNNWAKFGSMKTSENGEETTTTLTLISKETSHVSLFEPKCGVINHEYYEKAKEDYPHLLKNMYQFSPEANIYVDEGLVDIELEKVEQTEKTDIIYLKECNRCARYLPININNERNQLSYANHCVASHRTPCSHTGFGKLVNIETGEELNLHHGYQLECKLCKKFAVNAALNPQRTAAQMKEDATRRRVFEVLLTELYKKSPQLMYRKKYAGRELTNDILEKFQGRCFSCNEPIKTINHMHLDHTRPLALLWPLDETATCLCGSCNTQKRDRPPSEFYSEDQLINLAKITRISEKDLRNPSPNEEALEIIFSQLEWFFNIFCSRKELHREHDGKLALDLFLKSLQKTINKSKKYRDNNIINLYEKSKK